MTDGPDEVDLETLDLSAERRAALSRLFPSVLEDGVLDAAKLGELLETPVARLPDGRERYGLQWAGKQAAIRSLLTPSRGTLVPDSGESLHFDAAQNVFVEGDNLEVLKILQKSYNDRVKLIYIDPPYNTGNDFVYKDDFSDGLRGYLEYTGQIDIQGNRLSANVDFAGRRHSRWLAMMYPRLVLARNLLTQDGVIFVSIDDNEVAALRLLLDEVFGSENFLGTFVWVSNIKGRQISGAGPAGTKEYLHAYARNIDEVGAFRASASFLKGLMPTVYKGFNYKTKSDDRGPYVLKNELYNTNSAFNEATRPNLVFDIYYNADTGEVKTEPVSDLHVHEGFVKIAPKRNNNGVNKYHAFRWSRLKVEAESDDLDFIESSSGWRVYTKVRDVDSTSVKDIFMDISTNAGADDLKAIGINPAWFDYPKPVALIQVLVSLATDRDSLVLDFFAGSGTTAQAVMAQNALDQGARRSISVNLPEPLDPGSEPAKAGLSTVADVTWARIVAACASVPGGSDASLRKFSLGRSNFRLAVLGEELDLAASTLAWEDTDWQAVAAEVLLKEGVQLDEKWERHELAAAEVVVAGGVAVVLSDRVNNDLVEAALKLSPRVVVFMEDGFAGSDAVKANAFTNAKNAGITMKTV